MSSQRSPRFGQLQRHSNSPVPLRSPSPDIMTKSAIISTPPAQIRLQQRQQQNFPLRQEVSILKTQNKRLKRIIQQRGDTSHISLTRRLEEKDKVIDHLRIQLKAIQHENRRITSILENASNQYLQAEADKALRQQNLRLKNEVLSLLDYKRQYQKIKQSLVPNEPTTNQNVGSPIRNLQEREISQKQIDEIKSSLQSKVYQHINYLNSNYDIRLNSLERKIIAIEDGVQRLTNKINIRNTTSQMYGNSTNANTNSPPNNSNEKEYALNRQIQELLIQIQRLKREQMNKNQKIHRLEQDNINKQEKIRNLIEMVSQQGTSSVDENQYRRELIEENKKLKYNISALSKELIDQKNNRVYLEKDLEIMKSKFENQKQLNISQVDKNALRQTTLQLEEERVKNQKLNHKTQSLTDTLDQLRRTYNNTQNQVDQLRKENSFLKTKLDHTEADKADILKKLKDNSNAEVQSQTDNLKLRLRINQLEREVSEKHFLTSEITRIGQQLSAIQNESTQLKLKLFESESTNANLQRQLLKIEGLNDEIQMLKRTIVTHERSRQEIMKGSDHTRNELARISNQKTLLETELIQLKSNLRLTEGDLQTSSIKLTNLQKQYRKMEQQFNIVVLKQKQTEDNLNTVIRERNNLGSQYQILLSQYHIFEQERIGFQMEKGRLIQEINIRDNHIRQQNYYKSNYTLIEKQRGENLGIALSELIEVKKRLQEMNFDSIFDLFKEVHLKQILITKYKEENANIKITMTKQIQNLKKENLDVKHKIIGLEQNVERLKTIIIQLEGQIKIANQKNTKLDQAIRNFVYQPSDSQEQAQSVQSDEKHVRFEDTLAGGELEEIEKLRKPVKDSVLQLADIINRIQYTEFKNIRETHIVETHSEIISNADLQQSYNSRNI